MPIPPAPAHLCELFSECGASRLGRRAIHHRAHLPPPGLVSAGLCPESTPDITAWCFSDLGCDPGAVMSLPSPVGLGGLKNAHLPGRPRAQVTITLLAF